MEKNELRKTQELKRGVAEVQERGEGALNKSKKVN